MPGPAGMFGTVLWKHAVTARRGNSMRAVSAGSSMGPFVMENLKPTGAARSKYAGGVRCSRTTPARFYQKGNPDNVASNFMASKESFKGFENQTATVSNEFKKEESAKGLDKNY
jgi:hypothetical protein